MGRIHWRNQVSDDFDAASDWSGGVVPGAHDDAILDASGSVAYTVTASTSQTVFSLQTNALATLAVTGGTFTALGGTGDGKNHGTVSIGDGATFIAGGAFDNAKGTLSLNGAGLSTRLLVAPGGLALTGGGHLRLSDSAFNRIAGASSIATLTNVDNTLSGAGRLGHRLILANGSAGVIQAVGVHALVVDTRGRTAINDGLMEAVRSGGLVIRDTTIDGSGGGIIQAEDGARVKLRNAEIVEGTLRTVGSGMIRSTGDTVLDGTAAAVAIEGVVGTGRHSLTLKGTITNGGTLTADNRHGRLNTVGDLIIAAGTTTLTGGGDVVLRRNRAGGGNRIVGEAGSTLVNLDNTITGHGYVGGLNGVGANLTLINQGAIESTGGDPLTLDTGPNVITNAGLIQSADHGTMMIMSAVDNSGVIAGAGGTIHLYGTQTNRAGGVVEASQASGELDFLNATIVNAGEITATTNGRVALDGALVNGGAIEAVGGAIQVVASGGPTITNLATGVMEVSGVGGILTVDGRMSNAGLIVAKEGGEGRPPR